MSMGDRIKFLRESCGMTQEELGAKIGVQKSAIRKYEKGEVENIKRSSIQIMAALFGVSPCYLMCWEDDAHTAAPSEAARSIEAIQTQYGKNAITMLTDFDQLNAHGQQKAMEQLKDLLEVPKYQKNSPRPQRDE